MVEHVLGKDGVGSSILLGSTISPFICGLYSGFAMSLNLPKPISIHQFSQDDIAGLYHLALSGNHTVEAEYFETALKEQNDGKRVVFLVLVDEMLAGYVHLNFFPQYRPFLRLSIPEIQDLFVHPDFRCQGLGARLVSACEEEAKSRDIRDLGIGVGVSGKFGAAQRLYARLGYVPDGSGVVFEREMTRDGEVRPIDDRLCLMLLKPL